jgi:hypothetical protein
VDLSTKDHPYTPGQAHLKSMVDSKSFYSLILSAFDPHSKMGGVLMVESEQPMIVESIPPEGAGCKIVQLQGIWN